MKSDYSYCTCGWCYGNRKWWSGNKKSRKEWENEFEIIDLGLLKYFLGITVVRSNQGIVIFQWKYKYNLLKETRKLDAKLAGDTFRI